MTQNVWLKSSQEKLESLLADEAKLSPMLNEMASTIKQMKAKNSFRIALLNQLLSEKKD